MPAEFEITVNTGEPVRFRLQSAAGEVLLISRPLASIVEALRAVAHFKRVCVDARRYCEDHLENGSWTFTVVASDGTMLAQSLPFYSENMMRDNIVLTQRDAPNARLRPGTIA